MALLRRIADTEREAVEFFLDGRPCHALQGDTVLTAMLAQQDRVRQEEFTAAPRAGFCLMGACQDCWVELESGERLRACTSFIQPGMRLRSVPA